MPDNTVNFSNFANGGEPDSASIAVGYDSPAGGGKERLWFFSAIFSACAKYLRLNASIGSWTPVGVTSFVGGTTACLDGQNTQGLAVGTIVFTAINGFFQQWVVTNLGTGQTTQQDSSGNFTIIRANDTGTTGLCFVALN